MPWLILLLALAFSVPASADALSFGNCEKFNLKDCDGIRQVGATEQQQRPFLLGLLRAKDDKPIHSFIHDWNTVLSFNEIPYALVPESQNTIGDAWIIITSVMPSVLYGSSLFINSTGEVQTNFGYKLSKPPTYFNGAWDACSNNPPESNGDCRTEYPSNKDLSLLNVYLNGKKIGNKTIALFNTTQSSNTFTSNLVVVNEIERKHFNWQRGDCCQCRRCCWRFRKVTQCGNDCGKCGCEAYRQRCASSYTDYFQDTLSLSASKEGALEAPLASKPQILFDESAAEAYLFLNSSGIESYTLALNNIELFREKANYGYNFTYDPLNVLVAQAHDASKLKGNVYAELETNGDEDRIKFQLFPQSQYLCSLMIKSFFVSNATECEVAILPETELSIETDHFVYLPNETITAAISIGSSVNTSNDRIEVTYGKLKANITGSSTISIPVNRDINLITAEFRSDLTHQSAKAEKTISVFIGRKPIYYVQVLWFTLFFLIILIGMWHFTLRSFGEKEEIYP
ncbi:hypothetical protein HYU13_04320 [Candidatus Woesearchaeota archaeon]|nr:hypothetical protein [Candidatus Woesearchaeota archaeon]